ncbi:MULTISPECIES: NIL domain-containing protein [Trichocoleus]|uniref:NIL domain-containing protein n=1 Tax=Trichocoleus desertorum GB2-A4 TaxID=2933944 RepID=A0ABV0J196_9CYAN|nr:NIL domain-containing protein [Trichocoleus sp. FACHB-46]
MRAPMLEQEQSSGIGKPQTVLGARRSRLPRCTESATQVRIKLRIPAQRRQEPIISHLTAQHGLSVNITAARLSPNPQEDGWFDLELRGTPQQLQQALAYLQSLNITIWGKPNPDGDGWL